MGIPWEFLGSSWSVQQMAAAEVAGWAAYTASLPQQKIVPQSGTAPKHFFLDGKCLESTPICSKNLIGIVRKFTFLFGGVPGVQEALQEILCQVLAPKHKVH